MHGVGLGSRADLKNLVVIDRRLLIHGVALARLGPRASPDSRAKPSS
jgi:hypothetical protein